jgi:hypothetical protein
LICTTGTFGRQTVSISRIVQFAAPEDVLVSKEEIECSR